MFTLLLSSLFISVLSNYTTNLTIEEKDKYLACTEFVHLVTTYDKDVIKETLPQKDQLFQGVTSFISLTMTKKCLEGISDELVKRMYVNMSRVMKDESIDDSEIEFLLVNYSDFANLTEFKLEEEDVDIASNIKRVTDEYMEITFPEEMNKRREKKEKARQKLQELLLEMKNQTGDNETYGNETYDNETDADYEEIIKNGGEDNEELNEFISDLINKARMKELEDQIAKEKEKEEESKKDEGEKKEEEKVDGEKKDEPKKDEPKKEEEKKDEGDL